MCEMLIEKAMVIDDVEYVKNELEILTGKKIEDMEVVRRFICSEKNTKFFIDKKMNSSVNHDTDNTYVWLDTGFCDLNNNPLFISLLNNGREYVGHHVGTAKKLADNIKSYYHLKGKDVSKNYSRFVSKYKQKCAERNNEHIVDIEDYYLAKANEETCEENEFAKKIRQLNVVWTPDFEELVVEEEAIEEPEIFNKNEEEITIHYLLEKLDEREQFIQELLEKLENRDKNELEKDAKIDELIEIIKERTDALIRIRAFNEEETAAQFNRNMKKEEKQKEMFGHKLLKEHKKVIVVGSTNLSAEVMKAIITKEYGFDEKDFEYETDYEKIVRSSGRIINSSKYQAIIFGACPHSTMAKEKWSSMIERCKRSETSAFVVDARSTTGKLKVTKESFRKAISEICDEFIEVA